MALKKSRKQRLDNVKLARIGKKGAADHDSTTNPTVNDVDEIAGCRSRRTNCYYQKEQNEIQSFEDRCGKMMTKDEGPRHYCANCFEPLPTDRGGGTICVAGDKIIGVTIKPPQPLPTNSIMPTPSETTASKKVLDVLTSIYKLNYLKDDDECDDDESQIFLCNPCATILTKLYKYYDQFNQRRQHQSFLGKKINKLESMNNNKKNINFDTLSYSDDDDLPLYFMLNKINNDDDNMTWPDAQINYDDVKEEDDFLELNQESEKDEIDMMMDHNDDDQIPESNDVAVAAIAVEDKVEKVDTSVIVQSIKIHITKEDRVKADSMMIRKSRTEPSMTPSKKSNLGPKIQKNIVINKKEEMTELVCQMCRHVSSSFSLFKEHSRKHKGTKEFPFKCALCDRHYRTFSKLRVHLPDHYNLRQVSCPKCPKTYKSVVALKNHDYISHSDKPLSRCNVCYKRLRKEDVPAHMARHDRKGNEQGLMKRKQCPFCDKSYPYNCYLKNHLLTHTGENALCQVCGKMTKHKGTLIQHMISHSEERKYKCDYCLKSFKRRKGLTDHQKIHGERQYLCEICPNRFVRQDQLKTHVDGVHLGAKRKKCPHCPETFIYHFQLKNHVRTHQENETEPKQSNSERSTSFSDSNSFSA